MADQAAAIPVSMPNKAVTWANMIGSFLDALHYMTDGCYRHNTRTSKPHDDLDHSLFGEAAYFVLMLDLLLHMKEARPELVKVDRPLMKPSSRGTHSGIGRGLSQVQGGRILGLCRPCCRLDRRVLSAPADHADIDGEYTSGGNVRYLYDMHESAG